MRWIRTPALAFAVLALGNATPATAQRHETLSGIGPVASVSSVVDRGGSARRKSPAERQLATRHASAIPVEPWLRPRDYVHARTGLPHPIADADRSAPIPPHLRQAGWYGYYIMPRDRDTAFIEARYFSTVYKLTPGVYGRTTLWRRSGTGRTPLDAPRTRVRSRSGVRRSAPSDRTVPPVRN